MKNALFVSVDFPPMPQVGALRVAKLAAYLPMSGWGVHTLTVDPAAYTVPLNGTGAAGLNALHTIAARGSVHAIWAPNPLRILKDLRARRPRVSSSGSAGGAETQHLPADQSSAIKLRAEVGRWIRHLSIPDEYAAWAMTAVVRGVQISADAPYDLVWAFFPPPASALAGLGISCLSGKPLILDYRDPWTGFSFWGDRPRWRLRLDRAIERAVLSRATAVTVVNRGIGEEVQSGNGIDARRIHVLPQGVDQREAGGRAVEPPKSQSDGILRIVHAGTTAEGLADPRVLTAALAQVKNHPLLASERLRVTFVGNHQLDISSLADAAGVRSHVDVIAHVPRARALELLAEADVLLVIRAQPGRIWITGKIWDYLGLKRPLLALVDPESAAADLVRSTKTGRIAAPWDSAAAREALTAILDEFLESGRVSYHGDSGAIAEYGMESVARKAARIADLVAGPAA